LQYFEKINNAFVAAFILLQQNLNKYGWRNIW